MLFPLKFSYSAVENGTISYMAAACRGASRKGLRLLATKRLMKMAERFLSMPRTMQQQVDALRLNPSRQMDLSGAWLLRTYRLEMPHAAKQG